MASIPSKIKQTIEQLVKQLNANNITIHTAYLFGSFAKNNASKWSDIDIALISDHFEGNMYYDRCKVNPFVVKIDTRIEAHPFRTKDFTRDNPSVIEIIQTGIRII